MLDAKMEELRSVQAALRKLAENPAASQSVSSASGGSYSFTAMDIDKLRSWERALISEIAELKRAELGFGGIVTSYPIYC